MSPRGGGGEKTGKAMMVVMMRRAADGSGDGMLNIQEGKQVRSGGHQDGATTNRHGNQPQSLSHGCRHHGNPWDASRGSPHQVNKAALNEMRRTKGAPRSRDGRIACVREEGGSWRRMEGNK